MAKVIKKNLTPGRNNRRYPWDEWLDGQTWELEKGRDFFSRLDTIRHTARAAGLSRGVTVVCETERKTKGGDPLEGKTGDLIRVQMTRNARG